MSKTDRAIISERITALFKRKMHTQYWIRVFNDQYDQTYNFFFHSQRKGQRERSIPLHTVQRYQLEYLEQLIHDLRQDTQLTIQYVNFETLRWPESQRIIQRKRLKDE